MKKLIVCILSVVVTTAASWGQGTIAFQNLGSGANGTSVNAPVYDIDGIGGTLLSGTGFSVQLYAGPNDASLVAVGTPVTFLTGGFSGYFSGSSSLAVPGFAQNTTPRLQVRAWNNAGGTINSFEAASTRGASSAFTSPALGDDTPPIDLSTVPVPQGLTSFSLAAVPEPSVFALGGIGVALLLLRRRKA